MVGTYQDAKFPRYTIAADGYPTTTDVDNRLLIGYGANGDRNENYRTRPKPTNDTQQPGNGFAPLSGYPRNNLADGGAASSRPIQQSDGLFITGQVPGDQAVHTGGDIPLSAYGRGSRSVRRNARQHRRVLPAGAGDGGRRQFGAVRTTTTRID